MHRLTYNEGTAGGFQRLGVKSVTINMLQSCEASRVCCVPFPSSVVCLLRRSKALSSTPASLERPDPILILKLKQGTPVTLKKLRK